VHARASWSRVDDRGVGRGCGLVVPGALGLRVRAIRSNPLHRVERLSEPAAEVALARDQVEDPVLELSRVHAEPGVDEGSLLRLREQPVDEGAGVHAADQELLAVLHPIHSEQHVVFADRTSDHLAVRAAGLEIFLAFDLEHPRPPLRMPVDILEQLPDHLDWGLDEGLLASLGHGPIIAPFRSNAGVSDRPLSGGASPPVSGPTRSYNGSQATRGREITLQQMQIYGVSFDMVGKQPIVLLKTVDGNRFLPIWIGHPEAAAILMKLQGASTPRPMTHDLLSDLLEQVDAKCERVAVTELRDNTFYASITISMNGSELEIDSRPSDAIALAVRTQAPIFAADDVIDESSIEFEHEVEDTEEVVEKFKDFLDQVTPEDFAKGEE
jgi:bifunctional DNase/RNase